MVPLMATYYQDRAFRIVVGDSSILAYADVRQLVGNTSYTHPSLARAISLVIADVSLGNGPDPDDLRAQLRAGGGPSWVDIGTRVGGVPCRAVVTRSIDGVWAGYLYRIEGDAHPVYEALVALLGGVQQPVLAAPAPPVRAAPRPPVVASAAPVGEDLPLPPGGLTPFSNEPAGAGSGIGLIIIIAIVVYYATRGA